MLILPMFVAAYLRCIYITKFSGLLSSAASGGCVRIRVVLIAAYALSEFRLHLEDKRYANMDENPKSSNHNQGLIILVVEFIGQGFLQIFAIL